MSPCPGPASALGSQTHPISGTKRRVVASTWALRKRFISCWGGPARSLTSDPTRRRGPPDGWTREELQPLSASNRSQATAACPSPVGSALQVPFPSHQHMRGALRPPLPRNRVPGVRPADTPPRASPQPAAGRWAPLPGPAWQPCWHRSPGVFPSRVSLGIETGSRWREARCWRAPRPAPYVSRIRLTVI